MLEHLKENGISDVRGLNTRERKKCFKLAVNETMKNEVDKEELRREGVIFRPFRFCKLEKQRRQPHQIRTLEHGRA